jgi:parallel beta-helix repeat protein
MTGTSIPQGLWVPPRVATLYVAASDALDRSRAQADFLCHGIADQVEINQALNALPAVGGRVVLSEGQFILAAPIVIPANNIILEGQGWATFINGNNLLTNNHAVRLSAHLACEIKNLTVRTQAGGGKVSHCIFIEDGANDTLIENVYFQDSDSDAIHIEGTSILRIRILKCFIDGADENGIHITMDALNQSLGFHISTNYIQGCGIDGIHFSASAGNLYHTINLNYIYLCANCGILGANSLTGCVISNNYVILNAFSGIRLEDACNDNQIENNYCRGNGAYGIVIAAATCNENRLKNNKLIANALGAVIDLGTLTQLPVYVVPFSHGSDPQDSGFLIDYPTEMARAWLRLPNEVQQVVRMKVYARSIATEADRMRLELVIYGAADNEPYNTNNGSIADHPSTSVNFAADDIIFWTIITAGVLALIGGDSVEVKVLWETQGGGDCPTGAYFRTVEIEYV